MDHNKDLGDRKIDNAQEVNEGFSGENLPPQYNPAASPLKPEQETDADGQTQTVKRARNTDANPENDARSHGQQTPSYRGDARTQVEHQDHNGDPNPQRYPAGHPENNRNRGNGQSGL